MIRVAVAGLGGFAGNHHEALAQLEAEGECRVVATCDPAWRRMEAEIARYRLRERGVAIFDGLDAMLATTPDVATLPTPIPLHAAQHATVVAAGAACYLEKPPSLWPPEFDAMLRRDRDARRATQVGFNFVGDPLRRALKARIDAGEFGPLERATLLASWPRDAGYYARNDWAGRLWSGDRPVLDSPLGNALAHYVQNLLFWTDGLREVAGVRAWLARARPIESYDTACVAVALPRGASLRLGVTHAGRVNSDRETVELRDARIVFDSWRTARIERRDGAVESRESEVPDGGAMLRRNLREYLAYVRGERAAPTTPLADAAGFVALTALAFVSSGGIAPLDAGGDPEVLVRAFVEAGAWPAGDPPEAGMADLDRLVDILR